VVQHGIKLFQIGLLTAAGVAFNISIPPEI